MEGLLEALRATAFSFIELEDEPLLAGKQKILKLALAGRIGEAIETTQEVFPGVLENNPNLLFMLKCRQIVEMVDGFDSEVRPPRCRRGDHLFNSLPLGVRPRPPAQAQTSAIQSTVGCNQAVEDDSKVNAENGGNWWDWPIKLANVKVNFPQQFLDDLKKMEEDDLSHSNTPVFDKILSFGRELHALRLRLKGAKGFKNKENKKMMQNAFGLLAYSNPGGSRLGWQFSPVEREKAHGELRCALYEWFFLPNRTPMQVEVALAKDYWHN